MARIRMAFQLKAFFRKCIGICRLQVMAILSSPQPANTMLSADAICVVEMTS